MALNNDVEALAIAHQIDTESVSVTCLDEWQSPEELRSDCPRAVALWMAGARSIRRPWLASWAALTVFGIAILCGARPVGQPGPRIAFWTLSLIAIPASVGVFTSRADLRYVREGRVGPATVMSIDLVPAMANQGQVISWNHIIEVSMSLSSGDTLFWTFSGLPIGASDQNRRQLQMRCGDVIPVVWLPGRFRKTAKPYAFLKFNYDRALPVTGRSTSNVGKMLLNVLGVVLLLAALIGNLLALMWYVPVAFSVLAVTAIGITGGLLIGGGLLYLIYLECVREIRQETVDMLRAAAQGRAARQGFSHAIMTNSLTGWFYRILLAIGLPGLCGMTVVMWAFSLNTLLDQSPGADRLVTILGMRDRPGKQRTIEVTFQPVDEPGSEYSKSFAPRDLPGIGLQPQTTVQVEWHTGTFGWPWVTNFRAAPARPPLAPGR